jgi:hypothetical protein
MELNQQEVELVRTLIKVWFRERFGGCGDSGLIDEMEDLAEKVGISFKETREIVNAPTMLEFIQDLRNKKE